MAKGALKMSTSADGDGANDTGCGVPTMKPASRKATISTTLSSVEANWKFEECLTPVSWISDTSQTTPIASSVGDTPGTTDLPYSPKAIAASATGAANPTVAEIQPARKPKAG